MKHNDPDSCPSDTVTGGDTRNVVADAHRQRSRYAVPGYGVFILNYRYRCLYMHETWSISGPTVDLLML